MADTARATLERCTADEFKRAVGSFATGVTVVTTCDAAGNRHGLTANSFTSVSLDPPMVLFCVDERAPSLPGFEANGHFAINVLAADQETVARQFARPAQDKFAGLDWWPGVHGAPLLAGCLAWIECTLTERHSGGDHTIMVGTVDKAVAGDGSPLLFHRSRFSTGP